MIHLKGKFFLQDAGEYFRTGEIIESDGTYVYFKYDSQKQNSCPVRQATVLSVFEIAKSTIDEEGEMPSWSFFDSREELQKYMNWLNSPSKNEDEEDTVVVPIRGH